MIHHCYFPERTDPRILLWMGWAFSNATNLMLTFIHKHVLRDILGRTWRKDAGDSEYLCASSSLHRPEKAGYITVMTVGSLGTNQKIP